MRKWFRHQTGRLFSIEDTPDSIAFGMAIGVFLGFMPFLGLKTLLALGIAWMFGCNKVSAVIGVTLHDLVLPLMPALLEIEYQIGYWLMHNPHRFQPHPHFLRLHLPTEFNWMMLLTTGAPLILGSVLLGIPFSIVSFVLTRGILRRRLRKRVEVESGN